ncbi:hypothetical protein GCM10027075_32170 [Streptomyces heilongjiangensis]
MVAAGARLTYGGNETPATYETGSLRRHDPDQVLGVAVRSCTSDLPASQPYRRRRHQRRLSPHAHVGYSGRTPSLVP